MKKLFLLIMVGMFTKADAQIYMAKTCDITFLSPTSVENITAVNKAAKPLLNTATGDLQIKIPIMAFVFEKPLMQEHFNENYMETEKFPNAFFKGKINDKIDYTKNGEYKVTASGKLTIHGVDKDRNIEGVLTVKDGQILLNSTFRIKFADHGIEIPSLQSTVIPEDTEVKVNAALEPFKKN